MPAESATNLTREACRPENSSCRGSWGSLFSRSFSPTGRRWRPLFWSTRLWLGLLGTGLGLLLCTALCLQPAPQGFGTHQQLGLPGCTFLTLYGLRCPGCGMTTSWSHLMRGQLPSALAANVGGTMLAILAAWLTPWSLVSAVRGRWWLVRPNDYLIVAVVMLLGLVTLTDWCLRLCAAP